ncbi:hypothetical protein KUCAC02_036664, partial [Chaenocephalus aceratus]
KLYKFAFEGICSVLLRLVWAALNKEVPEETQKFIVSVENLALHPLLETVCSRLDYLFKISEELVQKKMAQIQQQVHLKQQVEGAYLTHLLLSDQMTVSEILGSITELLLAGVDTTSNTIAWSLYQLAKIPEIQEQLYQEVIRVCPGDKVPTSEDIAHMPYLKAIIRETLRLYPVVPGNARLNVENEIVVGDHLFPKKRCSTCATTLCPTMRAFSPTLTPSCPTLAERIR